MVLRMLMLEQWNDKVISYGERGYSNARIMIAIFNFRTDACNKDALRE